MRKFRAVLVASLVIAIAVFSLSACVKDKKTAKFTFVTNGGEQIPVAEVQKGDKYTLPIPQRDSYDFDGWYQNEDLSGEAVIEVVAAENATFYAKWVALKSINLMLDGGTLPQNKLFLRAGANLYNFMQNYVPTKSDHKFGAWYNGNTELIKNTLMPDTDVTLTAKYMVKYTVESYMEKLSDDSYEKAATDIVDYDYAGKTVSPQAAENAGFEVALDHDGAVTSLVLKETAADNVFKIYYNRKNITVKFQPNFPDDTSASDTVTTVKYGTEVEVPSDFETKGYFLIGWSSFKDGDVEYRANYFESKLFTGPVIKAPDKFVPDADSTFYGVWNKAFVDIFDGDDYIFLDEADKADEDGNRGIYLSRSGVFFKGTFDPENKKFTFRNAVGSILLTGIMFDDGTFTYNDAGRDGLTKNLYEIGSGVNANVTIYFDAYNGITYSERKGSTTSDSKGTYIIDSEGQYVATFTDGELKGQTLTFITGKVDNKEVFQVRNLEEFEMGVLFLFVYDGTAVKIVPSVYQLILSGYGTAYYNKGSSVASYAYIYDNEKEELTLINSSSGVIEAQARIMEINGQKGYMLYFGALDQTFKSESGATLIMDGLYNATYKDDTVNLAGTYTSKTSVFGGSIIKFTAADKTIYTFVTHSTTVTSGTGEDGQPIKVTTYSFEKKTNTYAEYYYRTSEAIYYAPLLVVNDSAEGSAIMYGYNTVTKTYHKVSSGTYQINEENGLYIYTAKEFFESDVSTEIVDLAQIKSFVFTMDAETTAYSVHYWYSSTTNDDTTTETELKEYTSGNGVLKLIAGFAIYSIGEKSVTGTYEIQSNIIEITTASQYIYLELDEDAKTFIELTTAPYTSYEYMPDGTSNKYVKLYFDGKGNVTYTVLSEEEGEDEPIVIEEYVGTVTESEDSTAFDSKIFQFTADEKTFKFIALQTSSDYLFARYNETYNGVYTSGSDTLQLDGFGFTADYLDSKSHHTGTYSIIDENVILLRIANDDDTYTYFCFDIKADRTFTLRDSEYGTYLSWDNNFMDGTYFELDGYGKLSVFTIGENDEIEYIDQNGTYTTDGDIIKLVYKVDTEDVTLTGKRGYMKSGSTTYNIFMIEHKEVERFYVNEADMSVLVLDSVGNAVVYGTDGVARRGNYLIITNDLLYYVNADEDADDACVYKYDSVKNTATPITFEPTGYFTKDLGSMKFTKYGFAVFDGTTRYYYNIEDGNVIIYRQANEGESANEYGFFEQNFGAFDKTKVFEGKTYYRNNGFDILFKRAEEGKDQYPVLVKENDKQPLKNLTFSPAGTKTFTVNGDVMIDKSYSCYVTRTETEMYVSVGNYRFYIEVIYGGENEDGTSNSTYHVTDMKYMQVFPAYNYLYYYYLFYSFFGPDIANSMPNNVGVITMVQDFDAEGEITRDYITGEFGEESGMYDFDGNLVSFECDADDYEVSESGLVTVRFTANDGYNYCVYFTTAQVTSTAYGYKMLAFTCSETLTTTDGYTVNVERIIASDNASYTAGSYFSAALTQNDEPIEADSIYIPSNDKYDLYYIAREIDKTSGKITSTIYYKIKLTEKEGSGEVGDDTDTAFMPYESVAVIKEEVTTIYSANDKSYVDIGEDGVLLLVQGSNGYLIKTSVYDETTAVYTVETYSGKKFTVKVISGEGGQKTIEVVEVPEPEKPKA